jgi:hypothetical protein
MTTEHKIKRLLNLYDGDLCYILDEFEKIRAVALAAEKLTESEWCMRFPELKKAVEAWRKE